ncbi:MAG: ABC transporter ATP-binding protein [Acidobacteriota bacterium]
MSDATPAETTTSTGAAPAADAPIVRIESLSKSYTRDRFAVEVLDDLDLAVQPGEFVALMGPSGSGKSTLLNLLAGIDQPSAGRIEVGGTDIARLGESALARWRQRHIGFIFQFYNLMPVLTAQENVELPLTLTRLRKASRRQKALTALDVVGLADRLDHFPRQLSGGQEQRVAIARAIVTDPTLLLADEPTGDLDVESAGEILDLLQQLNREFGKTIIMVTHDPVAAQRAGRIVRLHKGRLVADGHGGQRASEVAS